MEQIHDVLKSFIDPVFVIFILLLISLFMGLRTGKKKSSTLFSLLTLIFCSMDSASSLHPII